MNNTTKTHKTSDEKIKMYQERIAKLEAKKVDDAKKAEDNKKKVLVIRKRAADDLAQVANQPWACEIKWSFEEPKESDTFYAKVLASVPEKGLKAKLVLKGAAPAALPAFSKSWLNQKLKDEYGYKWSPEQKMFVKAAE